MAIYMLSIGLALLLMCFPIKGLPSQRNSNIEFYSDLEWSHLLLRERGSRTALDSRNNGHTENGLLEEDSEFILVTPTSKFNPKSELHDLASQEESLFTKKKSSDTLSRFRRENVEEGSGQSEGTTTTTTTAAPTTTTTAAPTTTTTAAPTTTTTTAAPTTTTTAAPTTTTTAAATTTTTTTTAPTTTTTAAAPTTTTTATTASPITTPRYIVAMSFVMTKTYITDYSNPQTEAYQTLAASIVSWSTPIYQAKYGSRFFRVVVISLRAVARYRADNTEAEMNVEFDQSVPDTVPDTTEVLEQLKQQPSPANLSVDTSTISVLHEPQMIANVPFTITNESSAITLAAVNSTAYRDTTSKIKSELEPFFLEDYSTNFVSLNPTTYTSRLLGGSAFKTPNPRDCRIRFGAAQRISSASRRPRKFYCQTADPEWTHFGSAGADAHLL